MYHIVCEAGTVDILVHMKNYYDAPCEQLGYKTKSEKM